MSTGRTGMQQMDENTLKGAVTEGAGVGFLLGMLLIPARRG